jgi:Cysteine rich repeat
MRYRSRVSMVLGLFALTFAMAIAAGGQPTRAQVALAVDCASELKQYCANVLPGQDREVACLIAYEDKIAPRCRLTAYLASGRISGRAKGLRKLSKQCSSDIVQYCSKIHSGGGRIVDCLRTNKATLTDDCRKLLR